MREEILRLDPRAEFSTPEGCYINELSNIDADANVSIARARVPARRATRWRVLYILRVAPNIHT